MLSHLKIFWNKFGGVEKRLLLIFTLLLLGSTVTYAATRNQNSQRVPRYGGTYTEGLVGAPQHINPLLATVNEADTDLARVVYSGLLKFDENLNLVPDLAENLPEINPNGREYTVKLKSDLKWHDGTGINADDVIFTYQAVQNPELGSPLRRSWMRVEVAKIDDLTVKITTRESSAAFIANLTLGLLPRHVWENVPASSFALSKFNLEPIGSGPYAVTEIQRNRDGAVRSVTLAGVKDFYGDGPYIENLVFKFYETTDELINAYHSRQVSGLGYVPFDQNLFIQPKENLQQIYLPLAQYQAIFINRTKNPAPLEDARVRLALAKSVDKQKIIDEVYVGQGSETYGPILPGYLGYHEQIPGADMNVYDDARAEALLEEAGWIEDPQTGFRKDKLGRTLSLSLATNDFPPNVLTAQALKKAWEAVGVQINLSIETAANLDEKYIKPRNYELLLYIENVGTDPDPYPFWHSSQLRDPGLNLSTFFNRTADRLLVEARANIAPADRAVRYRQFQEIFVGDVPAVFLNRSVYVYNLPKSVKGVNLGTTYVPSERFANIADWYVETKRVKK
ncbi:MAG: hypothetical protein A3K06_02270 [Candidatus Doudnabacteria bacterium RIFCSPHIGHO2_01_52_17]|uniref:Solute-binding protein family 5 domain-containing protein n=1 Tax=Candidatus Doudnabacteria bacterium RIFCSPHIGHO2_01_52_17 TaxID=1817820 RepID=A0A1F5NA59_9BACT|nr:MAG: hypothetical protein A3K06_02270 [Candidatus Doudnabacteria bacterium RIFCSPHIGHO2_01_52_17]